MGVREGDFSEEKYIPFYISPVYKNRRFSSLRKTQFFEGVKRVIFIGQNAHLQQVKSKITELYYKSKQNG